MPRFTVDGFSSAALAVVLLSLFNAAVRPVVLALAAPVSLILVGVLVLVLQVVSFVVVVQWAPGVHVVTSADSDNVRFYNRKGFIEAGRTKGSRPLVFLARAL